MPAWLPDETLFSWASRYHTISGNRRSANTCLALFGHTQQGTQHDFPTRLNHLVSATGGLLGDSHSIISGRTILPFFLHFVGETRAQSALNTLRGKKLGGLKFQLGLVTSRFRANHSLKACPTCLARDQESQGTPYWHLAHQYPGVWVCPIHRQPLLESTVKSTGVGRFLWYLPNDQELKPTPLADVESPERYLAALSAFAELSITLSQLPLDVQLDNHRLHDVYKSALFKCGLTTPSKRLRLETICNDYRAAVQPLSVIPELQELFGTDSTIETMLGRLLRMPRAGTHPLRHLALIYWLFADWPSFWHSYHSDEIGTPNEVPSQQSRIDSKVKLHADFTACLNEGNSVTHCSKQLGITVSTGMIWATAKGIEIHRRPKTITDSIFNAVTTSLRNGGEKTDLMKQYDLSAASIDRILRSVEGLYGQWLTAKFEKAQADAKSLWLTGISQMPGAGLKILRSAHPAPYAWLYRNDRQWLKSSTATLSRLNRSAPRSAVNWASRDVALAEKVRVVATDLQSENAINHIRNHPIALWQIYQRLPELKAKLGALKKLPLTKQAISNATQGLQQADLFDAGDSSSH